MISLNSDPINIVESLIQHTKEKLVDSGFDKNISSIMAMITVFDNSFFGLRFGSFMKTEVVKLFAYGCGMALNEFYDHDFSKDEEAELFVMNQEEYNWAYDTLLQFGLLSLLKLYLDYYRTGLIDIKISSTYEINVIYLTKILGVEYVERGDMLWNLKHSEIEDKRQVEKSKYIHNIMKKNVYISQKNFIAYSSMPEVDDFYLKLALDELESTLGKDFFLPDTKFGEIEYQVYLNALAFLKSLSMRHVGYFSNVLGKIKKLNSFNLIQLVISEEEVAVSLSKYLKINFQAAIGIIDLLTLNEENKVAHCSKVDGPLAPLQRISSKQLLFSYSAFYGQPVLFLLSELKRRYSKDWDRALNKREEIFRMQLYAFFNQKRYVMINKPIVIKKNSKVITDIDGVIFDTQTGELGLFQLKWQEPFASSPFERSSRKRNFESESVDWVNVISGWLENLSLDELSHHLGIKKSKLSTWNRTKLFILGRHSAHFSGDTELDERAAWGIWPQIIRLFNEVDEKDRSNTLNWLYDILKKDSPVMNAKRDRKQYSDYSWFIEGYRINIFRSHLQ
ncbi:hypothetical protein [Paenibacillus sp. RC84]|uniref:hypothetical protein n=1 Tax=Paenibacillus sp. RC84 TaxID=3156252 RepID=UPI0035123402